MKRFSLRTLLPWLLPILVWLVTTVVGFEGVYGQDAYEYERYTLALYHWWKDGQDPGVFFWPLLYPLLGSFLHMLLPAAWALQILSLGAFLGILAFMQRILQLEYPKVDQCHISWFLAAMVATAPYFLRSGLLCMSDMLAAFWVMAALYQVLLARNSMKSRHVALFTFFASAAFMTRYATLPIMATLGIWALISVKGTPRFWLKSIALVLPFALIPMIPHILLRWEHIWSFAEHGFLQKWSLQHLISWRFSNAQGTWEYTVPNVIYMLSPFVHLGYCLLGIPLLTWSLWQRKGSFFKSPFFWLSLPYLLFLGGIDFQNQRFFVVVFPLLVLAYFPLFSSVIARYSWARKLLPLLIVLQLAGFSYSFNKFYQRVKLEKTIAAYLQQLPSKPLYTFDIDVSFKHHEVPLPVRNIYLEHYDHFPSGSYVLVQPEVISQQWQGKNPDTNWKNMQASSLKRLHTFDKGWELYVIE